MRCRARPATIACLTGRTVSSAGQYRHRDPCGAGKGARRIAAVIDWDVHHGNGTEAIFLSDRRSWTLSVHQGMELTRWIPARRRSGVGKGHGFNMNIPLPPGAGHESYLEVMDRIVLPALAASVPRRSWLPAAMTRLRSTRWGGCWPRPKPSA
ncbi:MAG: hypothetical protein R3D46_08170 [Defluviimonas denitrificans]